MPNCRGHFRQKKKKPFEKKTEMDGPFTPFYYIFMTKKIAHVLRPNSNLAFFFLPRKPDRLWFVHSSSFKRGGRKKLKVQTPHRTSADTERKMIFFFLLRQHFWCVFLFFCNISAAFSLANHHANYEFVGNGKSSVWRGKNLYPKRRPKQKRALNFKCLDVESSSTFGLNVHFFFSFCCCCVDNRLRTRLGNLGSGLKCWPKPFVLPKVLTSVVLNP